LLFGTALAVLYHYDFIAPNHFIGLLIASSLLYLINLFYKPTVLQQLIHAFERTTNLKKYPGAGALTFVVGSTLAVILFSKPIAIASLLILAWGDSIGHLVQGKHRFLNTKRTWESLIIPVIAATAAAQFFVPITPALIASTVVIFLESTELHLGRFTVDDNLFIPLLAGLILQFLV